MGCSLGCASALLVAIIVAAVCLLLGGCSTCRKMPTQTAAYKADSVRVEYRERTVLVPDTVFLEIPAQTAERTTADTVSHLENDYAVSVARINSDGTLTHTLGTKPQRKAVQTARQIECRDSVVYRDRVQKKIETKTEYVERQRSWWEQAEIYGFWAALIALAIIYRKKIFKAVVRLFTGK